METVGTNVPVLDTSTWISSCYYLMLVSFFSVLVPRTFESKAGSLRRPAGGSFTICWSCISQFDQIFTKLPGAIQFRIADCRLRIERGGKLRKAEGRQNQNNFLSQSPQGPQRKRECRRGFLGNKEDSVGSRHRGWPPTGWATIARSG